MDPVKIGSFRLALNREQTAGCYARMLPAGEKCACAGCRNFSRALQSLAPESRAFFQRLGIDIGKTHEVFVITPDPQGNILYGGFTPLAGRLLSGRCLLRPGRRPSLFRRGPQWIRVAEHIQISFQEECHLLPEGFPRPCFQMDLEMRLPWVLPEKNPYMEEGPAPSRGGDGG